MHRAAEKDKTRPKCTLIRRGQGPGTHCSASLQCLPAGSAWLRGTLLAPPPVITSQIWRRAIPAMAKGPGMRFWRFVLFVAATDPCSATLPGRGLQPSPLLSAMPSMTVRLGVASQKHITCTTTYMCNLDPCFELYPSARCGPILHGGSVDVIDRTVRMLVLSAQHRQSISLNVGQAASPQACILAGWPAERKRLFICIG